MKKGYIGQIVSIDYKQNDATHTVLYARNCTEYARSYTAARLEMMQRAVAETEAEVLQLLRNTLLASIRSASLRPVDFHFTYSICDVVDGHFYPGQVGGQFLDDGSFAVRQYSDPVIEEDE